MIKHKNHSQFRKIKNNLCKVEIVKFQKKNKIIKGLKSKIVKTKNNYNNKTLKIILR